MGGCQNLDATQSWVLGRLVGLLPLVYSPSFTALPPYLCIPRVGRIGSEVFYDVMKLLTPKLAGTFIFTYLSLTLSSYFSFFCLLYCLPCTFPLTHLMQSYNCTFLKAIIITTTSPSLVSHEHHCNGSTINTTFSMMCSH